MFKRLKNQILKIVQMLKNSSRRFPETIIAALCIVIVGIIMNHMDYNERDLMEKLGNILMTLILSVPLFVSGKLLVERFEFKLTRRILIDAVIVLFAVLFYYFIPENPDNEFAIKYALLSASFYLIFSLVPYFYKRENYSRYVLKLITNFFVTVLFSLVLYGGINAIIFTMDQLFVLNIDNDIYLDIFIIIAGLFSITHFLGYVPSIDEDITDDFYPPVLKILFVYIIIPLLSIYTVIIYAYFIRLILLKEFPINLLSHLVVWYGLISVIILFFVNRIKTKNIYTEKFYRYFPMVIMLPLAMLFVAIGSRIIDFGITPSRYFVVISGIWVLGNMLYIFFSKKFYSSVLVITAIVVLLVAAYGPQSAFNLSLNNQNNRFENLLVEYDMLIDGQIVSRDDLSEKQRIKINEFIQYFDRNHSFKKIDVLPSDFGFDQMTEVFGFEYQYYYSEMRKNVNYFYEVRTVIFDVTEYNYYVDMNINIEDTTSLESDAVKVDYDPEESYLKMYKDGMEIASIDIPELMMDYNDRRDGLQPRNFEDASMDLTFEDVDIKIVISNMYYETDEEDSEEFEYGFIDFRMFIKWKE